MATFFIFKEFLTCIPLYQLRKVALPSEITSLNISMTLEWMKFDLLLLEINRDYDVLVDISASQTVISANAKS